MSTIYIILSMSTIHLHWAARSCIELYRAVANAHRNAQPGGLWKVIILNWFSMICHWFCIDFHRFSIDLQWFYIDFQWIVIDFVSIFNSMIWHWFRIDFELQLRSKLSSNYHYNCNYHYQIQLPNTTTLPLPRPLPNTNTNLRSFWAPLGCKTLHMCTHSKPNMHIRRPQNQGAIPLQSPPGPP